MCTGKLPFYEETQIIKDKTPDLPNEYNDLLKRYSLKIFCKWYNLQIIKGCWKRTLKKESILMN